MDSDAMDELIEAHTQAEIAGDAKGAAAVYTDDVEHDVVGWPTGPNRGPEAARAFYGDLMDNFTTESMERTSARYGDDFCVTEHLVTGTVPGNLMGVPGGGRRITFRMLHVWGFRDGAICRENIWFDVAAVLAQLDALPAGG
jgi:steroid delta-isomerase-like uncharacterized protein